MDREVEELFLEIYLQENEDELVKMDALEKDEMEETLQGMDLLDQEVSAHADDGPSLFLISLACNLPRLLLYNARPSYR